MSKNLPKFYLNYLNFIYPANSNLPNFYPHYPNFWFNFFLFKSQVRAIPPKVFIKSVTYVATFIINMWEAVHCPSLISIFKNIVVHIYFSYHKLIYIIIIELSEFIIQIYYNICSKYILSFKTLKFSEFIVQTSRLSLSFDWLVLRFQIAFSFGNTYSFKFYILYFTNINLV